MELRYNPLLDDWTMVASNRKRQAHPSPKGTARSVRVRVRCLTVTRC